MPELRSEAPTEQELKIYLDDHWQKHNKMNQYFLDEFGFDFSETYELFYSSILKSLIRLNEFSRKDKFWKNTNNNPTIYKLEEFCKIKLQENENDILALQTILALTIINGYVEEKFSEIIERLVSSQHLDVETLIEIYLMEDLTYDDNSGYFAEILFNLGLTDKSMPKLLSLSNLENQLVSNWAKTVLGKITNQ